MQTMEKKRFIKKICIIGDPAVGKTSLILKYVKHTFSTQYLATIGAVTYKKEVQLKNVILDLVIWDIAGEEMFDKVSLSYFKGAEGTLVVCDVLREETYTHMEDWINSFYKVCRDVPIIFLANKIDLVGLTPLQVSEKMMDWIAKKYNTEFLLTSAKNGKNVENAFFLISQKIMVNK